MKLNELTIKQDINSELANNTEYGKAAEEILKKYGWNVLGTGSEGAVAEHPNKNYVLKFFKSDSSYCKYITGVVMYLPNNIHVPRISRQMKTLKGTKFNYICMEKLSELDRNNVSTFIPEFYTLSKISYQNGFLYEPPISILSAKKYYYSYNIDEDIYGKNNINKPNDDWFELCHLLIKRKKQINTLFDLHEGNFMVRGNTLVITDPYYG